MFTCLVFCCHYSTWIGSSRHKASQSVSGVKSNNSNLITHPDHHLSLSPPITAQYSHHTNQSQPITARHPWQRSRSRALIGRSQELLCSDWSRRVVSGCYWMMVEMLVIAQLRQLSWYQRMMRLLLLVESCYSQSTILSHPPQSRSWHWSVSTHWSSIINDGEQCESQVKDGSVVSTIVSHFWIIFPHWRYSCSETKGILDLCNDLPAKLSLKYYNSNKTDLPTK